MTSTDVEKRINEMEIPTDIKRLAIAITNEMPIRQFKMSELLIEFKDLINKTHVSLGYPYHEAQILMTIEELCIDMAVEYGYLRMSELKLCFKRGYKEEYGKFFGLNNATYFKWVKAYIKSPEMLQAKAAINKSKELLTKPPEPTPEERDKMVRDGIALCYTRYVDGMPNNIIPSVFYDYLYRKQLIDFSLEAREKLKLEAYRQITAEQLQLKSTDMTNKHRINNYLESLTQNDHDVIFRAKQLALKVWFDELKEKGADINLILQ